MMRITFVVPVLDVSGGARIIAGHAQRLASRGHEVVIVAPCARNQGFKNRVKRLFGIGSRPIPLEQSHYGRARLTMQFAADPGPIGPGDVPDADVIIATWWETAEWIWPLPSSKGTKVHFIQHYEAHTERLVDPVNAVWRLPMAKIAVAQWLVDLGRHSFGIERIALVPNSVEHDLFSRTPRDKADPPTIGFLFHGAGFKDIPTTLAAVERVQELQPETKFLSFGPAIPRRDQLPAKVEFHHLPAQQQIARIYGQCDVWLSTSQSEGFNLPPLEAMASGCPAVCAKTGRPLELIENGVNGYLVDAGDVAGFADALANILSLSNDDWKQMSHAASRAVAHPTWAESSALFEQALDEAIASPA